jgi:hypothetical protein
MLHWYLNDPAPDISYSILALKFSLGITEVNFMKFSEDITNALQFHAVEYITHFLTIYCARQRHFETTKWLV